MLTLQGKTVFLRALEPDDLEFVFSAENNEEFWEISTTSTPYSKFILKQYLKNSHKDIYEAKQLRLVICTLKNIPIGLIDLFDFEPKHKRAALGILICNKDDRGKGFGAETLSLISNYCFTHLNFHQLYANVGIENVASQQLFEKADFVLTGQKKDWNLVKGKFKDELLYQLIQDVY